MKGEANLAPLVSVGMGQHSGRTHIMEMSSQETVFSTTAQRRFVILDNLHIALGRTPLSPLRKQMTWRLYTNGPPQVLDNKGKVAIAAPLSVSENASVRVCTLTMITRRMFWKSFLKPSVELQNRAKFPSRSCWTKHRDTANQNLKHTNPGANWAGTVNNLSGSKRKQQTLDKNQLNRVTKEISGRGPRGKRPSMTH